MEYFLGSVLGMATFIIVSRLTRNNVKKFEKTKVNFKYSQSRSHTLVKPLLPFIKMLQPKPPLITQSTDFKKKQTVRVLILKDYAYWIKDNSVWKATIDGKQIQKETAQRVDTMGMSKIELDQMMFIVEKLTKGESNDNSNSGQQDL